MIVILFFNWYGYRIVTEYLMQDADKQLEARLDNNQYDESALIEIRVPINIPYQTSQSEFERHYGEMQVDGQYYTYVKRKIDNGYLVLMCIPNVSKQKIKAAGNDFFKLTNGLNQDSKKQNNSTSVAKNFWSEYDDQLGKFDLNINSDLINRKFRDNSTSLTSNAGSIPEPPPCTTFYI